MIIVLCKTYQDACDAFDMFMAILEEFAIYSVVNSSSFSNTVQTDDDLKYIFIDERYRSVFEEFGTDIVLEDDFFINLGFYFCPHLPEAELLYF